MTRNTVLCAGLIVGVLLCLRRNWFDVYFRNRTHLIELQWYSVDDHRTTDSMAWNHASFDLARIAQFEPIPETRTTIVQPPKHAYIPTDALAHVNSTSFVKVCCLLSLSALRYRPKLRIGITVSRRKDDRKGTILRLANCHVNRNMTPKDICETFSREIQRTRDLPVEMTLPAFLRAFAFNDFIFNNWRGIETMSGRSPQRRLLTDGIPGVNMRKRWQQIVLSNDTAGWYIVNAMYLDGRNSAPESQSESLDTSEQIGVVERSSS